MKNKMMLVIVLSIMFLLNLPVSAEKYPENPSFSSFGEVVQKLPEMWDIRPDDVLAVMRNYPDFECWKSYEVAGCVSVNNKYSAEIHVNFEFDSEKEDAALTRVIFSMEIDSSEDVQKLVESFWLPGMAATNIQGADFPDDRVTMYFSTENTLMNVAVPWPETGDLWLVYVSFVPVRG